MTFVPQLPSVFKDFDRFIVGFDEHFNKLAKLTTELEKNASNYPPYNIRKAGDNKYVIELAVAGFAESEIELTLDGGRLVIKGNTANQDGNDFIFRGIANRAFTRTFAIDDNIEIQNAELINGMLKVFLERMIPEEKKPKKIAVNAGRQTKRDKQLLTESA